MKRADQEEVGLVPWAVVRREGTFHPFSTSHVLAWARRAGTSLNPFCLLPCRLPFPCTAFARACAGPRDAGGHCGLAQQPRSLPKPARQPWRRLMPGCMADIASPCSRRHSVPSPLRLSGREVPAAETSAGRYSPPAKPQQRHRLSQTTNPLSLSPSPCPPWRLHPDHDPAGGCPLHAPQGAAKAQRAAGRPQALCQRLARRPRQVRRQLPLQPHPSPPTLIRSLLLTHSPARSRFLLPPGATA